MRAIDCGATQVVGATTRTAQGKFCALTLSVKNVGRSPVTFVGRSQTLADANQSRFEVDPDATADHPANAGQDMLTRVINPGNQRTGVLVFDIPVEDKPTTATPARRPRRIWGVGDVGLATRRPAELGFELTGARVDAVAWTHVNPYGHDRLEMAPLVREGLLPPTTVEAPFPPSSPPEPLSRGIPGD